MSLSTAPISGTAISSQSGPTDQGDPPPGGGGTSGLFASAVFGRVIQVVESDDDDSD